MLVQEFCKKLENDPALRQVWLEAKEDLLERLRDGTVTLPDWEQLYSAARGCFVELFYSHWSVLACGRPGPMLGLCTM